MSYPREGRRAIVGTHVGTQRAMRRVRSGLRSLHALTALAMLAAHAATAAPPFATDPVNFATQLNVPPGQLVESAPVTVSGIATNTAVRVLVFNGEISKGCTGIYRGNYLPLEHGAERRHVLRPPRVRRPSRHGREDVGRVRYDNGYIPDEDQAPSTWGAFVTSTGTTLDPTPDPLLVEPDPEAPRREARRRVVDAFTRISGTNVPSALMVTNAQHGVERAVIGVSGQLAPDLLGPATRGVSRRRDPVAATLVGVVLDDRDGHRECRRRVQHVRDANARPAQGPRRHVARLQRRTTTRINSNAPSSTPTSRSSGRPELHVPTNPPPTLDRCRPVDNGRSTAPAISTRDERSDLMWRNASTGETAIWLVNDAKYCSPGPSS